MSKAARALRKENNYFEEKLTEESQDALTDIVAYLRVSKLSEYNQEQVRKDINQMLFDGEQRGVNAREIIGADYKGFCDEIISCFPDKTGKDKFLGGLNTLLIIYMVLIPIFVVQGVIVNLIENKPWDIISITWADILLYVMIAVVTIGIVNYICRNSFENTASKFNIKLFLAVFFIMVTIFVILYFLRKLIFTAAIWKFAIAFVVGFVIWKIIDEIVK